MGQALYNDGYLERKALSQLHRWTAWGLWRPSSLLKSLKPSVAVRQTGFVWLTTLRVLCSESSCLLSLFAFVNLLQLVIHFLPWFPSIFYYFSHRKPVVWKHTDESSFSVFPGCSAFYRAAQHADQCSCVTDKFPHSLYSCAVQCILVLFHSVLLWFYLVKIG